MSNSKNHTPMSRRQALLLPATAGMGAALALPAKASDSTKTAAHQAPGNCSTPRSAVAKTPYGKVRGYVDAGVFTFKGIPTGRIPAARTDGSRLSRPSRGMESTPPSSMRPTVHRAFMTIPRSSNHSSRTGTTAT